ncbi:hypothetical protein [Paenibacillus fonticola]|uniref:hypothetical protein n=1 Tax=Paenibacillus fonticola TaxID=379896 RepID=UPI0012FBC3BA
MKAYYHTQKTACCSSSSPASRLAETRHMDTMITMGIMGITDITGIMGIMGIMGITGITDIMGIMGIMDIMNFTSMDITGSIMSIMANTDIMSISDTTVILSLELTGITVNMVPRDIPPLPHTVFRITLMPRTAEDCMAPATSTMSFSR